MWGIYPMSYAIFSKLYHKIHAWKPEWKYLDPVPLVDKLIEGQRSLVHAKRGVPGLDEEVCGSLPMKPVMSPSPFTFLVSNSQLPEKLKAIPPCHPVPKSTVPIVLSILSTHQERTAIRITVIKKLNCRREDIPGYVKLIRLGPPCFIELKSFSFVGGTRHHHGFFLSSLLPTFPGQTSDYSVVSVHHESKAVLIVLMVRRDLFVGWEMDSSRVLHPSQKVFESHTALSSFNAFPFFSS
ncbi:S-adenosyl-L-methionine-dependent tRNA 4-demethylwyosine synthase like protein [Aduncisulcus paluster]|uniref:S-adenosyl-L-methionine-dependent tRNA 4-demethylwyosine synthase like protein n=1 Tax=Aduncisulcus paluster TaxID=2918883 RepID=A0ABQ5JY45_9EUKA|nr:S-adenosyl-L-methionine-dependent tRNA 4-demethylwyosine synthase like protein [Aduncisulcus paluster]